MIKRFLILLQQEAQSLDAPKGYVALFALAIIFYLCCLLQDFFK